MSGRHGKIGKQQLAQLRRDGPAALRWQQRHGLAKAQSLCIGLLTGGVVPFVGLFAFGWSAASMLLLMAVDVLAALLADLARLLVAGGAVRHTHAEDLRAQQVLSIVGGLEDGTGTYTDHGKGLAPAGLFAIALACTIFLVPVMGASLEPLGLESLREAIDARFFREFALASLVLHAGLALLAAVRARRAPAGDVAVYLDAGGVIGLFVGLLVLVWLPLTWGAGGVIALLVLLFAFRLAFGAFALFYLPHVTRALQRRLAEDAAG